MRGWSVVGKERKNAILDSNQRRKVSVMGHISVATIVK